MAWCEPCDRYFSSWNALEDHYEHNSRHNWCRKCDRHFSSPTALLSHRVNSGAHNYCRGCGEDFDEEYELRDHIDRTHWYCDDCDEFFKNQYGLREHYRQSPAHFYCADCDKHFANDNNLRMHLKSSTHVGRGVQCKWCPKAFPSIAALTLHLESATCASGITRSQVNAYVRSIDRQHIVTKRLITGPSDIGPTVRSTMATAAAWNGSYYECYFCSRGFSTLAALNQHLNSPAHEAKIYRCPHCRTETRTLSGLVQHVESESCGVSKFPAANRIMDKLTASMGRLLM
ncbi:hypothetical protein GLOTRDRAFT_58932 [Gloeophyllum trabeum ATCC 11539]|uniref:C2H2-type domain-containing protein n=1 Tax=Gloeophyllum trabeum (strain ATCC 11539 / FP-39264 / Madison 617) TaxID=670483 RepID=S7QDZ9_GLOTA|nr:uncharacterized protein GLOTRDRAFT_58932 [Gloeophyllum trabeum ATCC 11539]EPQ57518.1 hypothetical protein GLOTRDRAFT_58932 [Gloeophyllum trabeum ATCC 11539]